MSLYRTLAEISGGPKSGKDEPVVQVPEVTTLQDKQSLINNNKLVIVDVYADWCGPCQIATPLYAKLYTKYKDLCVLVKENVELGLSRGTVTVVPTFQIYIEGKLSKQITGVNIDEIEQIIKLNLKL